MNDPFRLSRRTLLQLGASSLTAAALGGIKAARPANTAAPKPFTGYAEVLETLEKRERKWRVLGCAPDQSPIVAVKCGGDKLPAIFISGGVHGTEHAGAVATVEVIEQLKTDHAAYVIPVREAITRAAMDTNGFRFGKVLD